MKQSRYKKKNPYQSKGEGKITMLHDQYDEKFIFFGSLKGYVFSTDHDTMPFVIGFLHLLLLPIAVAVLSPIFLFEASVFE